MARNSTIDKFRGVIFDDCDEMALTDAERSQLLHIRAVYTLQLSRPTVDNKDIIKMLGSQFGIKNLSQAYRIIAQTHLLLGSVPNASKQWIRYMVVEALKNVIEHADRMIADSIDESVIVKALDAKTKAADKLAKYACLNVVEPDAIPYDDIVDMKTEFVTDPSVKGLKVADPYGMVERLKKKYTDYTEVPDE